MVTLGFDVDGKHMSSLIGSDIEHRRGDRGNCAFIFAVSFYVACTISKSNLEFLEEGDHSSKVCFDGFWKLTDISFGLENIYSSLFVIEEPTHDKLFLSRIVAYGFDDVAGNLLFAKKKHRESIFPHIGVQEEIGFG